jgi:hypothetical protein
MSTKRGALAKAAVMSVALGLLISSAFAREDRKKREDSRKHYALIFGTVYGSDDRPIHGVRITIRAAGKKHPSWELVSDHRGEFAQRVPPGPSDYEIKGEAELAPVENGKPQVSKKKKVRAEAKVHIAEEERQDVSLHLTD